MFLPQAHIFGKCVFCKRILFGKSVFYRCAFSANLSFEYSFLFLANLSHKLTFLANLSFYNRTFLAVVSFTIAHFGKCVICNLTFGECVFYSLTFLANVSFAIAHVCRICYLHSHIFGECVFHNRIFFFSRIIISFASYAETESLVFRFHFVLKKAMEKGSVTKEERESGVSH